MSAVSVCGIGLGSLGVRLGRLREKGFPLVLALMAFFGSLQLLDAFSVGYYPMIHRATNLMRFDLGVSLVAPLVVLLLFWVGWMVRKRLVRFLGFPVVGLLLYPAWGLEVCVGVASLLAVAGGLWRRRCFGHFFFGVFGLLSLVEGLALLHWVVFVPLGLASPAEGVAMLELGFFYISGFLAPLLVMLFLFMWILKPLFNFGFRRANILPGFIYNNEKRMSFLAPNLLLVFAICLSVIAALYPYGLAINPEGINVGVDLKYYLEAASIVENDPLRAFTIWEGSRPLIFLLIFWFQRLIGSSVSFATRFLPVILNPLLIISSFYLSLEIFNDRKVAGLVSFFTACGYQITVNAYSHFLSNVLALSLVFFSLSFLFRALRCENIRILLIASLLSSLIMFTHPWTFVQYFAPLVLIIIVICYHAYVNKASYKKAKMLTVFFVTLSFTEILKVIVFRGVGVMVASSNAVSHTNISFSQFWYNSIFSFRLYYGGLLSSIIFLGLAIVGVYLFGRRSLPEVYFTFFLIMTSILFLFEDGLIQSRLIFNIPIGMFTAYGFLRLHSSGKIDNFKHVFYTFIIISNMVYLFRSLNNLI